MNLFGIEITLNGKKKNNFVKQDECHRAQDSIKESMNKGFEAIGTRFDDIKDLILNNGKR